MNEKDIEKMTKKIILINTELDLKLLSCYKFNNSWVIDIVADLDLEYSQENNPNYTNGEWLEPMENIEKTEEKTFSIKITDEEIEENRKLIEENEEEYLDIFNEIFTEKLEEKIESRNYD